MSLLKQRHEPVLAPSCTLPSPAPPAAKSHKSHKPAKLPKAATPPNSQPGAPSSHADPQTPLNVPKSNRPALSMGAIPQGKSALSTLSENRLHSSRSKTDLRSTYTPNADTGSLDESSSEQYAQNQEINSLSGTQSGAQSGHALDQPLGHHDQTAQQTAEASPENQDTDREPRPRTPQMHVFHSMQSPTPVPRGDNPQARRAVSHKLPAAPPKQLGHAHSASVPSASATPRAAEACSTPRAVVARKSHRRARSRIVAPIVGDSSEGLGLSFDGTTMGAPPSPLASPQIDQSFTSFYSGMSNPLLSPGLSSDSTSPRVVSWPPDELAPLQDILVALARKERRVLESRQELADAEDDLSRFRKHINSRLGPTATRHVHPQIIARHALINVGINSLSLTPEPEHDAPVGVWLMDEDIHYVPPTVVRRPKPPRGGLGLRVVHLLLDTVRCIISVLPTYQAMPVQGGIIVWRPDYPSPTKTLLYAFPVLD